MTILNNIYKFLSSYKLAMALLVIILACCLSGVTIWRGAEAWMLIFNSLWFNGLLFLLVINVACCFFGRIWGRRVTVISFGMILFHLSFVCMFLAIVYNTLFCFRGDIRLTEGESIPSGDLQSYDSVEKGLFFNFSQLRGETSLIKMHADYKVSGNDKRAAYEISVGEENNKKQGIIYITHKLTHRGFDYFNDKEGYSLLIMLSDKRGQDLYGAHVPLQSIVLGKDMFEYSTGFKVEGKVKKDVIPFPAPPETIFALKTEYIPSKVKERAGDVHYLLYPLNEVGLPNLDKPLAEGMAAIGESFAAGEYFLTVKEVRYWVGMKVSYEPGKPIVLTSLWVALAGMIITTVGRMVRRKGPVTSR
ncbi:MAG: hypothetical protein Q7U10_07390 [Thermodesulfovibrionia bacterium]|nr:hypothetical protein [Thermodesulfovibrionia bacterium]